MRIDLSDLNEDFLSANGWMVPNGVYVARLVKAEVGFSKAGNRQVVWDLEVRIPSKGRDFVIKKFNSLQKESLFWLKQDLMRLRVILNDINEIYAAIDALTGAIIEIGVETGDNYHTVHFIRLITGPNPSTESCALSQYANSLSTSTG